MPELDSGKRLPKHNFSKHSMQPKITTAEHQISFTLSEAYTASVYTKVETTGYMQYQHFLVVHSLDKQPIFFVCAEWFDENILEQYGPTLGVFSSAGHENYGDDKKWSDIDLFVLSAIEIATQQLGLADEGLNEGEAWALTQVLKKVQCLTGADTSKYLSDAYLQAMSKNDGRLVVYLQASGIH